VAGDVASDNRWLTNEYLEILSNLKYELLWVSASTVVQGSPKTPKQLNNDSIMLCK
jgi:hypothetical protein